MPDDLPPEIQVEPLPDGVRYRFPRPDAGVIAVATGIAYALLALAIGVATGWIVISAWKDPSSSDIVPTVMIACISALSLFGGLIFVYLTALLLVNPAFEVDVRGNELRAVFRSGPFRRIRRRPVRNVERIVIDKVDMVRSATDEDRVAASTFGTVYAEGHNIRRLYLVPSYLFIDPILLPRTWLRPLAADIAGAIDRHAAEYAIISRREREVEVKENVAPRPMLKGEFDGEDAVTLPLNTDVVVQKSPDRTEVRVPVPRLRSLRSVRRTLSWTGAISGVILLLAGLIAWHEAADAGLWLFPLLFGLVLACSIGYVLHMLVKVCTSAEFEMTGETFAVHRRSLRGHRTWQWACDQVVVIWVKPIDRMASLFELSIICEGDLVQLLRGRDVAELEWIAAVLRDALGLSRRPDDEPLHQTPA